MAEIAVDDLKRVLDLLLARVADNGIVRVELDAFWSVPSQDAYDIYREPSRLTVGMVSASSSHALAAAGKKPGDIVNITWIELPPGNGNIYYRTAEQTVMDGLVDRGFTLLNRRNPEIHLKYGGVLD